MPKHLVIVELPAKARTIERYLGEDYQVLASYGHVRDLPENPGKGKFGVDVDHDFAPEYVIPEDRRKQVSAIEKAARGAVDVFLATDLDREGEAIAWHVAEAANVPAAKTHRVTFNEITEGAIREAFAHPREIDRNLVDAQQARRIVDRLVGYTLSPLISRKVRPGLSAGRVQSVAVRLVVEREREITAFVAREYWSLEAVLATPDGTQFGAEVSRIAGKTLEIGDGDTAHGHAAALRSLKPVVDSVTTRPSKRNPAPPFTTSTLQQEASRKLGFSPKRTMGVAQRLYEGADTPDGHVGLITYMRTDSTAIAGVAMAEAQDLIRDRYGERYGTGKGRVYKTGAKGAQEAHESIRPTSFLRDPDSLQGTLEGDELRLYRLIWQRAVASQMASKEVETTTAELVADDYRLRASAMRTVFDGYARVYTEGHDDSAEEAERSLPPLAAGDVTSIVEVTPNQHFTEPPPRFTEASLIKALEEHGIGRPSTYAATISTIVERGYVRVEQRRLHPEVAASSSPTTSSAASRDYVNVGFTAGMEEDLDKVASGEREWVPLLARVLPAAPGAASTDTRATRRVTTSRPTRCARWATRWSSGSGRNGPVHGVLDVPRAQGDAAAPPGDEAPPERGGPTARRTVPSVRRGDAGHKARPVRRLRRLLALPGLHLHPQGRAAAAGPAAVRGRLPQERATASSSRVAPGKTGNVFWGCSSYPKCDFTTNHEPTGAIHDAHDDGKGAVARRPEGGLCLTCGATVELPEGELVGLRLPGGPPDPAALQRPARAGGRRGGGTAGRGGGARRGTRSQGTPRSEAGTRRAAE